MRIGCDNYHVLKRVVLLTGGLVWTERLPVSSSAEGATLYQCEIRDTNFEVDMEMFNL